MPYKTLKQHLFKKGPKKILSLDGGGIRGVLSLEYLKRIEEILSKRYGNDPKFRLCDYFDIIGGTSTGAVIATCLALGFSVKEIQKLYSSLARTVFKEKMFRFGLFNAKFPKQPLIKELDKIIKSTTLGSDRLKTGLMIVAKRIDTKSPWIFHNNPKGIFYDSKGDSSFYSNKDFLLKNIILASTAAPHYFEPEKIMIAKDLSGAFVDGGISAFNNPSLQMLMLASLNGYGFKWELGEKKLLIVSVGTGFLNIKKSATEVLKMSAVNLAAQSLLSIMSDTDRLAQTMLQWMSNSQTPWEIDQEISNLDSDLLAPQPLLSYLRYETIFEPDWIYNNFQLKYTEKKLQGLFAMDNPENIEKLILLGKKAASVQIRETHFPKFFNEQSDNT
jgi:hypothetical protein